MYQFEKFEYQFDDFENHLEKADNQLERINEVVVSSAHNFLQI